MARVVGALLKDGSPYVDSSFIVSAGPSWASCCIVFGGGWSGGRTGPDRSEGLFEPSGGSVEDVRSCSWT